MTGLPSNEKCPIQLDKRLLQELPVFENFVSRIGLKKIDGSVFGLLVLSENALTQEEIGQILGISQSAVSQSLKKLDMYGAIESTEQRAPRLKTHTAKEDALQIVASVFRKRELEYILDLKKMAKRLIQERPKENSSRMRRIHSVMIACELGESMINFLLHIAQYSDQYDYKKISKRFKEMLSFLSESKESNLPKAMALGIAGKIKDGLMKFTGDHK